MQTNYEQFAVTSMLGQADSPPRFDGRLCFGEDWQRLAFGTALALAKSGHFDWEDFRLQLIASIGEWEKGHSLDDASWNYYEHWLAALERVIVEKRLASSEELAERANRGCADDPVAAGGSCWGSTPVVTPD